MQEKVVPREVGGRICLPVLAGLGVGILAFIPDSVSASLVELFAPVVSSGFGWGLVALVVAMYAPSRSSAMTFAVGTLVLSTVTYYSLILVVSRRWQLGVESTGNGWMSHSGLASVAKAMGFWLFASVCGGIVLGVLAFAIRHNVARKSAIVTGLTLGLIGGEGAYGLFHALFIWEGPLNSFLWRKLYLALAQLLLTGTSLIVVVRVRKQDTKWPLLLVSFIVSLSAAAILWHLIAHVRQSL